MAKLSPTFVMLALILLASTLPMVNSESASEESTRMCCSAGGYDLHLIGRDSTATLTPFDDELGGEERVLIENAVTQLAEIHSWEYSPGWGGAYPDSTWQFSLPYEVNNAAGIEINATVEVSIGSRTYEGYSGPGNTYLPAGSSTTLEIPINVEAGNMGGTDTVSVSLRVQTLVFSLPGSDAGVEFIWGTEDNHGFISVELPLLDINMAAPVVEGRSVFLQMQFSSGFGTKMVGSTDITLIAGGTTISTMPVLEIQGQNVLATWTWSVDSSLPDGTYSVNISLVVQEGAEPFQGELLWDLQFGVGDGGSGGVYYPNEEPPITDGSGSRMDIFITGELSADGGRLMLARETKVTFHDSAALWLRWGLNNLGNTSLDTDSTWTMFVGGDVTDEMRNNHLIDEVEIREISQQLQSGRLMTFLDSGLFLESEELLGGRFSDFQTIEVQVETHGENRIMHSQISIVISTTQMITDGERYTLVRSFIKPQTLIYWDDVSLVVEITSSAGTSFAKIFKDSSGVELSTEHKRLGSSESLQATAENIDVDSSLSLSFQPTTNPIYSPGVLLGIVAIGLLAALIISWRMSKNKSRLALLLEVPLAILAGFAYVLAYPMETLVIITGGTGGLWMITAAISPRRLDKIGVLDSDDLPEIPTIDCPKCSTSNPITTSQRPTRIPCGGCGVILKIVE
ncbi:MAG: hypothetical protein CXX80_10045 [Methanobacteriota archaeon]|nr:MAG: hypothetical protein CXX80_10045 [Euryarchaeota archaeon]